MLKRFVLSLAVAVTLGQGCLPTPATYSTSTVTPTGDPSPEGPVAFREGFGKLPGTAPKSSLPAGPRPSIVLGAELPKIPPEVTILRERSRAPNETLLRNIALAVQIPAETLGRTPTGTGLELNWRDDQGYRWTFFGDGLLVNRITPSRSATVLTLMDDRRLIEIAKAFLDAHGILTRGWGKPELSFSWSKWWTESERQNRCMDDRSRSIIRGLLMSGTMSSTDAPLLPFRDSGVRCVDPEFPVLQSVNYAATRDEQLVLDEKGESAFAARIAIDAETGEVANGWFELPTELDRSNYPALSPSEVLERLRAGGLNPIEGSSPAITISLDSFVIGLYRHMVIVDDQYRSYFIPALWARGSVRRADGSTTGYATVVPLVRDEEFSG